MYNALPTLIPPTVTNTVKYMYIFKHMHSFKHNTCNININLPPHVHYRQHDEDRIFLSDQQHQY